MPQALAGRVSSPADLAALSETLRAGAGAGTPLHVRGAGRWWSDAPPDAELVSLERFDAISDADPTDLVVTAGAGARLDALAAKLAERGAFLALDPPGGAGRSVGGVLACGGAGPLAAHFGRVRDQVLGLTVVAGDGTVVRLGGRVVKNVAGFDLAKLVIGGHGGFGVIAEAHLRVRALPRADRTRAWCGTEAWVRRAAGAALAAGATPAALEIVSPELAAGLGLGGEWALLARGLGFPDGVDEELEVVARAAGGAPAASRDDGTLWTLWREAVGRWPAVLRLGAGPAEWGDALALARRHLGGPAACSVTAPLGSVRVGTEDLDPAAVTRLRADAAVRGWPVTLERASAATRAAVGVWGGLPPAADRLARALRSLFDPAGILAAPLFA